MKAMKALKNSLMGMGGAALVVAVLVTGCGDDLEDRIASGDVTVSECVDMYINNTAERGAFNDYMDCISHAVND